jgi:hypothetical protein
MNTYYDYDYNYDYDYDYDPEKVFCPNPYDYSYPNVTEKVLGLYRETYDKLVKGLIDVTISTVAGLERYSYLPC